MTDAGTLASLLNTLRDEGFTPEVSYSHQYRHPDSDLTVLVSSDRVRMTFTYPTNGYWRMKETAEFPLSRRFLPAIVATLQEIR